MNIWYNNFEILYEKIEIYKSNIKLTIVIFGRRLTTFFFVRISHKTLGKMLM